MSEAPSAASPYAPATAGDLLHLVREAEVTTRAELGRRTGLSRTAVASRVGALVDIGLLAPAGTSVTTGGRPAETLSLHADSGRVVALAVGRSRSQVGVVDMLGRELASDSLDHDAASPPGPSQLLPRLASRAATMLGGGPAPVAVGLSLPAAVSPGDGAVLESLVLPAWGGAHPARHLGELTRTPLVVGNDADVLAAAELAARPGLRDALVVKASTGIGVGIVADGRVLHGHDGAAGELGHVRLPAADGLGCRCGGTGCLEAVAGGWALVERLGGSGHIRDLVAAATRGDRAPRDLLTTSARHLGETLAAAANLLNPELIVLGGDMGAAFDLYAAGVRESLWPRLSAGPARSLRLVPSELGDRAGLAGAAAVALDRVLSPAAVDTWLATGRPHARPAPRA